MLDLLGMIAAIRRPRLLIRAARFGSEHYARAMLPRLTDAPASARAGEAVLKLIATESLIEDLRLSRSGAYSSARHVAVLAALLGEARLLREATCVRVVDQ